MNKPEYIILHHTGGTDLNPKADTSNQTMEIIDAWHAKQKFPVSSLGWYCGYHYVIEKYGKIRKARQEDEEGAHTVGQNNTSIGICLTGNFDVYLPTSAQIASLKGLLRELVQRYGLAHYRVVPHRFFATKSCYGVRLPDNWGQTLLKISLMEKLVELYQKVVQLMMQKK